MKIYSKIGFLIISVTLVQARFGSSFGGALAGSFIGGSIANAAYSPSYVVERPIYVSSPTVSSSSTISLGKLNDLKRQNRELKEQNNYLIDKIRELDIKIRTLQKQLKRAFES